MHAENRGATVHSLVGLLSFRPGRGHGARQLRGRGPLLTHSAGRGGRSSGGASSRRSECDDHVELGSGDRRDRCGIQAAGNSGERNPPVGRGCCTPEPCRERQDPCAGSVQSDTEKQRNGGRPHDYAPGAEGI